MYTLSSQSSAFSADGMSERLWLTPPWARNPVALVPARLAVMRESNDEDEVLSPAETRWLFETLSDREPDRVREFVARLDALSHRASDDELRRLVADRIETGSLMGIRRPREDDSAGPWRALRRLVKSIEAIVPGGLLRANGRQHRLLAGIDLIRLADRDQYELATQKEATALLGEISHEKGALPPLVSLLAEARSKLSRDWRPPLEPDGLVLLRRKVTNRVVRPLDVPILTPSQMVPRQEKSWIEIELVDEDGEPYSGDVELTLSDGRKMRSSTNAKGLLRLDGIVPGNCQVTLPDLDASGWAPK